MSIALRQFRRLLQGEWYTERPIVAAYPALLRDWSLFTGRGGYKMGESWVRNFLRPPSRQDKTFRAPPPPLKSGKFSGPPPTIWLKLQATAEKLPQNFLCPPFSMARTFSAPPPLFVTVKLHMPPLPFCSPPPPRN